MLPERGLLRLHRMRTIDFGSFLQNATSSWGCRYQSNAAGVFPPLGILFAGSDHFSATALNALHREYEANQHLISAIHVLSRKPRLTGRRRNIVKEGYFISTSAGTLSVQQAC